MRPSHDLTTRDGSLETMISCVMSQNLSDSLVAHAESAFRLLLAAQVFQSFQRLKDSKAVFPTNLYFLQVVVCGATLHFCRLQWVREASPRPVIVVS